VIKLTNEQKEAAVVWFQKYAKFGFIGREEMNLTLIRQAIGYEGSSQSFSKWWRRCIESLKDASPDKVYLQELHQELKGAIALNAAQKKVEVEEESSND
jgi:hypothetical protein